MQLEDFIGQSLIQIMKGVSHAQRELRTVGGCISPTMRRTSPEHSIGEAEGAGGQPVSFVEFDVAVTATESTNTKGGVGVVVPILTLGVQGQSGHISGTESRIRFKVPVLLRSAKVEAMEHIQDSWQLQGAVEA